MADKNQYNQAWNELGNVLTHKKVTAFFDKLYADIKRLYQELDSPHGNTEQDAWDWAKQEFFEAHKRAIAEKEHKLNGILDSFKQKKPT